MDPEDARLVKSTDLLTRETRGLDGLPSDAYAWFTSVRGMDQRSAKLAFAAHSALDVSDLGIPQHEIIWAIDIVEHRLIGLTLGAACVYGRSYEELVLDPSLLWEAVHPGDRESQDQFFRNCVESGAHVSYFRIIRPDGVERHISQRAIVIRNDAGEPVTVKGMQVDVTDEQVLTNTLDLYRLSIDKAHDSVFIMDMDFRLLEVNEAACSSLGYYRRELIGKKVSEIDVDFSEDAIDEIHEQLRSRGSILLEGRYRTREGRLFPVEISANLCPVGNEVFVCAFARDISKRKEAEDDRRERVMRLQRHKEAFAQLVGVSDQPAGDRRSVLNTVCSASAKALETERVSVWLMDDEGVFMTCESIFERTSEQYSHGMVLAADDYPAYFQAVHDSHLIDAHAAMTDPRTREFTKGYLRPLGITSMLDVSIHMSGRMVGVVCFEHVGSPRTWSSEEASFAGAIAEHVAHLMERRERQEREAELSEERRRLQTLIRSLPGMAFRNNAANDWAVEFISEGCVELTGWQPEDMINDKNVRHIDVVHVDDQKMVWETMDEALRKHHAYEVEYRIVTRQGEEKWVWEKGQGVYAEDGEVVAAEGFVTDITGRIRAEQALRDSEFRHRELFNNMSAGVAVFETDGGSEFRCTDLNMAGEGIDSLDKTRVMTGDACEVFTGLEASGLLDTMRRVWQSGNPERVDAFQYRDDFGESWRKAYVYKLPSGEVVLVYEDITEDMKLQADLRLKQISINQSYDAIFWIGRDGSFIDVNDMACRQYGYEKEELLQLGVFDLTGEYTRETWEERWLTISNGGFQRREGVHVTKDGASFPVDITISHLNFEGSECLCALVRDITARKEAEEHINRLNQSLERRVDERTRELQDSREKYRVLIESLSEMYIFYSLAANGDVTYLSPSVEEVLGYDVESLKDGKTLFGIVTSSSSALVDHTRRSLRGENQAAFEVEIRHINGEVKVLDVTQVPVCDDQGAVVSVEVIAHDITEHKRNLEMISDQQDQLLQSEKMAALGSLVAGVAHEINTPVSIGVTAASHLEERIKHFKGLYETGKLKRTDFEAFLGESDESTRMIMSNLDKAVHLIQGFKGVAVDQTGEGRRLFNLRQYLDEILLSLHPEFKRTGHTVTIDCPDGIMVDNYPGAISHTVTNLVMNSFIHGFQEIETGEVKIEAMSDGETVTIRYSDNGAGMSREIRRQIFDPFFTTRRDQGGSGLGMHVVYNSVTKSLGGSITCASSPGAGSTFTIEFPLRNGSSDDAAR